MPTYEVRASAYADYRKLSREQRRAFRRARAQFIEALRSSPPVFSAALRVKGVQGAPGVFELTFAPDGRATSCAQDPRRALLRGVRFPR